MTNDITIPLKSGWNYLEQLFLARQEAEHVVDPVIATRPLPAGFKLLFFNEADAGFGDVAFAMKLVRLLKAESPDLRIIFVSSAPEKLARFAPDPHMPVYTFESYAKEATAEDSNPDFVLSAPGIFDNCRIKEQTYEILQLADTIPFFYLAEYGSIRQLKDDAFKGLIPTVDKRIDAALDTIAARENVPAEDVGFHGRTGKCVVVEGEDHRDVDFLTPYLVSAEVDNPIYNWLTQPCLPARSAGLDVAEIGIFIDDTLGPNAARGRQVLGHLQDKPLQSLLTTAPDAALYSGYAHSGFEYFISYVAAIEAGKNRPIDIVMPNARTGKEALEAVFDDALKERLAGLGVGRIKVLGNASPDKGRGAVDSCGAHLGAGKELRLITRYPLPHQDMRTLLLASEPSTIVSGDQSFSEAVSAGKSPVIIEPVYCQTWVLDAQLALAESIDIRLREILDFAMQFKWDDAKWETIKGHLKAPDLSVQFARFTETIRSGHRANQSAVHCVKRAILSSQSEELKERQRTFWQKTWASFDPEKGLTIRAEDLEALRKNV